MARPFLFGGSASSSQQSQYLVQFKAGKMEKNGVMVSPIKDKKGLIYLHQSQDDSLMHFCWKDRTSGTVEDDLILFPDDAEFLKVPQCTTGRVFVLKFKTSPRRLFFWSQEAKDDKDDEYVSKINEYINNPSAARNSSGGHSMLSPSDMSINADDDLRNLFTNPNVSAQQLMSMLDASGLAVLQPGANRLASMLGSLSGSSNRSSSNASTPAAPQTPTTTPAVASSNATSESSSTTGGNSPVRQLRLSDLQNILSGIQPPESEVTTDLATSVNIEVLRPLLTDESFMERVRDKLPNTTDNPPSTTTASAEQFTSTVQSPQFQQALSSFCTVLQSGQLGPVVQQFGLSEECIAAANSGNLEAFVKALEKKQSTNETKKTKEEGSKKDDKFDDESMALD